MPKNYLYISNTLDGWVNLAYDEWFLDHVGEDELVLYFYVNGNAVIIGKNQNPRKECDLDAMARDQVQLVRRISGGGAVYHDEGNLNFSFNAGINRYDKDKQHRFILETVASLGIPCEFSGRNDLLSGGRKFSGNAYCGRGNAKQHHGTLLISSDLSKLQNYLTVDPRKMKAKGVDSVRSRVCNLTEILPTLSVAQMKEVIPAAFRKVYGDFEPFVFTDEQKQEIEGYIAKHSSDEWLLGATPDFDAEIDERLSFGGVQTLLTLKGWTIAASKTFSDANDETLAEKIDGILTGLPFHKAVIAAALENSGDERLSELAAVIREKGI